MEAPSTSFYTTGTTSQSINDALQSAQMQSEASMRAEIKRQIEEVMLSSLNPDQTPAHLVDEESCPYLYYQREQGHLVLAAKRLCQYWTLRVYLFKDRAFKPLKDLSGNGALSLEDLEYMRGPTPHVLNLPKDLQGRTVMFVDAHQQTQVSQSQDKNETSKKASKEEAMRRQRCEFYYVCYLSIQNPMSLSFNQGAVLIILLQHYRSDSGMSTGSEYYNGSASSISAATSVTPALFLTQFTLSFSPAPSSLAPTSVTSASNMAKLQSSVAADPNGSIDASDPISL
jgi:hypothetical protein